ncbi:ribokinase [Silvimonas iriomotensis]|uniref:Ribokinase n=1 Tax=Silvimonas iriomotensis TaxID=449662 RepID=A0ABQ2P704_9NEIS|nr:ribokinase [Silvimonas iriomotensis]GGP19699.1 ribokinase [Silvimonas iriomotensis]
MNAVNSNKDEHKAGHVLIVGSLNMDLVGRAPRLPKPGETLSGTSFATIAGGKGGNQAVAAARLGAHVAMIGATGADSYGAALRAGLADEGINCSGITTRANTPTGVAMIIVDDASQNAILIVPGANGEVTPAAIKQHEALVATADVVVCQLEVPHDTVLAALQTARRLGKVTILNPAPVSEPLLASWLPEVDYLIPNEIEAATLSGIAVDSPQDACIAAQRLRALGARNVLITLGARGLVALTGEDMAHYPGTPVKAIDTTAAGDTFTGGFAAALARGASVHDAILLGQRAAAISVTRAGAQPSIPYLHEVEQTA